jgi:VanZ family protein
MTAVRGRVGRLRPWFPALGWAALIFVLSAIPGAAYPHTDLISADKLVHIALYGVLAGLCARGLLRGSAFAPATVLAIASLLSALYGLTDEAHQHFVPGRNPDWRDVVADATGSVLGALVIVAVRRWRRRAPVSPAR